MRSLLLMLALPLAAGSALAEDRNLMRPTRDVEVEYHGTAMAGAGDVVTMHFSGAGTRIRIDSPNGRGSVIMDPGAGRMIVLMTDKHMYLERPADPSMMPMFNGVAASLVKTGTATVAGLSCTVYDAAGGDHKGQVCLTDDGVMLRATSDDHKHELTAVKVKYGDQPASLFEPPAGYQKLDIPAMPNGMPPGMGGPPMGPRGGMMPGGTIPGGMMPGGAPPR